MNKIILLFILVFQYTTAQNQRVIDSVNSLPFEYKLKHASTLHKIYDKNLADAKSLKYKIGEAQSYANLALVYYYQGKYNLNVSNGLKAIKMYEEMGLQDKLAAEYAGFGYSMKRRNLSKALYYMQKGKRLAEKNRDSTAMLSIYNNYGVLKEMQNDLDSALYFYNKGLAVKRVFNDSVGLPFSYNNIAGVYVLQGKFSQAEKLFQDALTIRIKRKDDIGIAENYTCFGDLFFAKKDFQKAIEYYRKSAEIASKLGYIYLAQTSYKRISDSYDHLGRSEDAFSYYKLYSQYKDSLLNKETNEKIAELDISYETSKKEQALRDNQNLLKQHQTENSYRTNVLIVVLVLIIFIALSAYLLYRQQKLKNTQLTQENELKVVIAQVETQNKLQEQRLTISRDLHDNIGSQLTFIISSVDNIRYAFDLKNSKLDAKLQNISSFSRETIVELRDTIWAMNNDEIPTEALLARIGNFVKQAEKAKEQINFSYSVDEVLKNYKFSSIVGVNLYRIIQEAVNNAIKHANPTAIKVMLSKTDQNFQIQISDNGRGFSKDEIVIGNGFANMEKRISDLGGDLEIVTSSEGTVVKITMNSVTFS